MAGCFSCAKAERQPNGSSFSVLRRGAFRLAGNHQCLENEKVKNEKVKTNYHERKT